MKKLLLLLLLSLLALGIYFTQTNHTKTTYNFYHWTSNYQIQAKEKNPPKYIKVLDISYRRTLEVHLTNFKTKPQKNIVPIIYLDNSIWSKMRSTTMVKKVLQALKKIPINYHEIQVDCDWTNSSKNSYFQFLKALKKDSSKKLSATIRLHQVKYHQQTGVPPVDYGVLMYYNMSDFKDIETKNYILDLEVAKEYHYNFKTYPLPLNLALPLYAQGTIIRFSKVVGLVAGLRERQLDNTFQKIAEHRYRVTKTHYLNKHLFYEDDIVRVDEVSIDLLRKAIEALEKVMPQPKEIIFYRWGNREFYDEKELKSLSL